MKGVNYQSLIVSISVSSKLLQNYNKIQMVERNDNNYNSYL